MTIRHRRFRIAVLVLAVAAPLVVACTENTHTNPPPSSGDQDAAANTAPTPSARPSAAPATT
ncbi:MAG TPA: hypothetical protein VGH28_34140 [Polyangiaceae bacterium]|jgi:hypothetical protein